MKKIVAGALVAAAALTGVSVVGAQASEGHPKPGTSCSIPGSRGVYHGWLLRCGRDRRGHLVWRIVGHL